jgi:type I restriction enzyme S subunit
MGGYLAYPEYKESGVEWLGAIPAHWKLLKIKRLTMVRRGASPRPIDDPKYFDDDGDYAWVRIADVTASERYLETTTQRLSELGKSLSVPLEPGEIFLSIAGSVGKPIITKIKCCIHDGFVYFPALNEDSEFLYFIFSSGQPYLGLEKLGTQLNLNTDTVGGIYIGLPSIEEQRQIAAFLDYKTGQIDALIAKKEALLEKLAEKRTALISQAVTKGLDPTVPMQDSGIPWLGDIPTHWEVSRIRFMTHKIEQGWSPPCHNQSAEPDEWGVLKAGCVNGENFDETENKALPDELEPKYHYEIRDGDILMSRANTKELLGSAAISINPRKKLLLCDKLYRLSVGEDVDRRYLIRLLRSSIARFQYERDATGSSGSMQNIGQDTIKDLTFPVPPLSEQIRIREYLDESLQELSNIEETARKAIFRLKEYRTALITNAVTGKIDVRDIKLPTPTPAEAA